MILITPEPFTYKMPALPKAERSFVDRMEAYTIANQRSKIDLLEQDVARYQRCCFYGVSLAFLCGVVTGLCIMAF